MKLTLYALVSICLAGVEPKFLSAETTWTNQEDHVSSPQEPQVGLTDAERQVIVRKLLESRDKDVADAEQQKQVIQRRQEFLQRVIKRIDSQLQAAILALRLDFEHNRDIMPSLSDIKERQRRREKINQLASYKRAMDAVALELQNKIAPPGPPPQDQENGTSHEGGSNGGGDCENKGSSGQSGWRGKDEE